MPGLSLKRCEAKSVATQSLRRQREVKQSSWHRLRNTKDVPVVKSFGHYALPLVMPLDHPQPASMMVNAQW